MGTYSTEETAAYREATAILAALCHGLFDDMVKAEWYGMLADALKKSDAAGSNVKATYREVPDFHDADQGGHHYLDCWEAREFKQRALGKDKKISDDQYKALVEEVLRSELDTYGVELRLEPRFGQNDADLVLHVYPKAA